MKSNTPQNISPDSTNSLIGDALSRDLVTRERLLLEPKVDFKLFPEGKYSRLNEQLLNWRHFTEGVSADFQLIEDNRENDLQKAIIDAELHGWMVLYTNHKPTSLSID